MTDRENSFPGKILVTTDFSDASFVAFPFAANEARNTGSEIELVNVFQLPAVPFTPYEYTCASEYLEKFAKEERAIAEQKLEHLATARFPELKVSAVTLETLGTAGDEIVDYAAKTGAGLIVTATHGRGFLRRALLGSVAERVLRRAHCPVMIVPSAKTPARATGGDLPYRRIVVTTDFSPTSEEVFRIARSECERSGAELVLLHVSEQLAALDGVETESSPVREEVETLRRNYLAEAARRIENYSDRLRPVKFSHMVIDPVYSVPNSIVEFIQRVSADLLIISARGRTARPGFLGGVVERVVRESPCPVLVVPASETKGS